MTYPKFTRPTEMKKGGKKKKSSGKPKPTNPSLWSRAKALARKKFDVYPSAYANGWAAKWYKSKGGGWRGGSKKKANGGPTPKVQSAVDNLMATYFSHLTPAQQKQVATAVFLDDNSLARTTALVESGNLEGLAKSISENELAMKLLKGEEIGMSGAMNLGKEMFPAFKTISDATGIPGRQLIKQGFQDVRDLGQVGYLKSMGYETDPEDTKAFEVMGTLNDPSFVARQLSPDVVKFKEYVPQATGGPISYQQGGAREGELMKIQAGGTHEESPLGGVPIGEDAEGRQVLVEEGETIRKGEDQDFVFSDRLKLTKQEAEEFGIDKKFVGQTFATISEKLEKRSPRRSDPIDKQTLDIHLNKLEEAQETFKSRKLAEAKEMYGDPEAEMQAPAGPPPNAMPGVGTQVPPSPEQFAGSSPQAQAMLAQRFPGQFGGGAPQGMPPGMPRGASPMMMSHGGPYHNEDGSPATTPAEIQLAMSRLADQVGAGNIQPGVYTNPEEIARQDALGQQGSQLTQGTYNVFRTPETDSAGFPMAVDFASIPPGNPVIPFAVGPAGMTMSTDDQPSTVFNSALTDAESRSAAQATTGVTPAEVVTDQGEDTDTSPEGRTAVENAADNLNTAERADLKSVKTVVDEKTGERKIVRTYKDGSTQEFVIPDVETPKGLTALQAAPIASNLITAAMLPDKFDFNKYRLAPDDSIIQKRDVTPLIRDVERMVATGRGALQGRASSTAELLTGLANLTAVGMAETGKIRNQQYQDYLEEIRNQQLINLNIAKTNSEMRAAVDTANADLEKERLSLINSAATEASKLADALRQEGLSKYELEQMYMMYPYLVTSMPEGSDAEVEVTIGNDN